MTQSQILLDIILIGFGANLLIRNTKVEKFRGKIHLMCSQQLFYMKPEFSLLVEEKNVDSVYDSLPSHYRMVFSFKRLYLKSWLSEEQIRSLHSFLIATWLNKLYAQEITIDIFIARLNQIAFIKIDSIENIKDILRAFIPEYGDIPRALVESELGVIRKCLFKTTTKIFQNIQIK